MHGMPETTDSQLRIEEVVEGRSGLRRASAVRELLHSPVLKSWLFVVQENTAVLDSRGRMRASRGGDVELGMLSCRHISPPGSGISSERP